MSVKKPTIAERLAHIEQGLAEIAQHQDMTLKLVDALGKQSGYRMEAHQVDGGTLVRWVGEGDKKGRIVVP